jgi:hypothetical protein
MTYQISRNGSIIGTFTHLEVMKGLMDGTFLPTDHYWKAGMAGWETLEEFKFNQQIQSYVPQPTVSAHNTVGTKTKIIKALWIIFALLMPYFGAWRIIFDKSLGFSRGVKIFFSGFLIIIMVGFITMITHIPPETKEQRIMRAVESLQSDSMEERIKGLEVITSSAKYSKDIVSQNRLGDIYQGGQIDGKPDLIEAYAWYTVASTTHKVGTGTYRDEWSAEARDAQFELDEYERKRIVISRDKQAKLAMIILRGYKPGRTVATFDGEEDPHGGLANYIQTSASSLLEITKKMSPAQIEQGKKRVKEITK